jgi:hypothetical protein
MKRRDFLALGARAAVAASVLPLPGGRAAVARTVALTPEAEFEGLLAEGASVYADLNLHPLVFEHRQRRLVEHAERLTRRLPTRVSAWYVAARCRWIDIEGEWDDLHVLELLDRAVAVDPGHLPSIVLARHISDFVGAFEPLDESPLLDKAIIWAERLVQQTANHPAAAALLRAQREFRHCCTGGGDCVPWAPGEKERWQQLEEEIRHRRWDGISVAALPLW